MKDLDKNLVLTSLSHTKQISDAFNTFAFDDTEEQQNIKVYTEDRSIMISKKILLISSSCIRSLLSSLPNSTDPVFIIPESTAENIEFIVALLASGEIDFKNKSEKDITRLVDDAKTLGIELSNLNLGGEKRGCEKVKVKKTMVKKEKTNVQEQIDTFLLKSISNLLNQCTVCLKQFNNQTKLINCYSNHFFQEIQVKFASLVQDLSCHICNKKFLKEKTALLHIANIHRMINVILKEKGITQIAKDDTDPNCDEKQEVLDKSDEISVVPVEFSPKIVSSISLRTEESLQFDLSNIAEDCGNANVGNFCEVCNDTFTTTDRLWIHLCEVHFVSDLQINLGKSANTKKGQCNICDLKLKSEKELAVHTGTVHRKLNELLMMKGYMPLDAYGASSNDENKTLAEVIVEQDNDIIYPCQICGVGLKHMYSLWRHICSTHYMKMLKSDFSHLVRDGLECDTCGVKADSKENLMKHIGISHFKLNDLLSKHGREKLDKPSYSK